MVVSVKSLNEQSLHPVPLVEREDLLLIKQRSCDNAKLISSHTLSHTRIHEKIATHRIGPKSGLDASTTTAFCTIDRVTSASFTSKLDAAICWLHLA
jgi:hypothetical protein